MARHGSVIVRLNAHVRFFVCGLWVLLSGNSAQAAIDFTNAGRTQLDAFAQTFNGEVRFEDFFIVFVDSGDGVLDFEEIAYFSGVNTILPPLTTYTSIRYVPAIVAVANASPAPSPTSTCPQCWEFRPPTGADPTDVWDQGYWSYESITFNSALFLDDVVNGGSTLFSGSPGDQTYGAEIELFLQNAELLVDGGTALTAGSLRSFDTGIVNLEGAASSLVLIGDRSRMELSGQGSALAVTDGGLLDASAACPSGSCDLLFGTATGDSVTLTVDGNGSALNTVGGLSFGFADADDDAGIPGASSRVDLFVSNGASMVSGDVDLGVGLIGASVLPNQVIDVIASVTGVGTTWNAGTLNVGVGNQVDANLSINGGGTVVVDTLNTGVQIGSIGNVQVDNNSLLQVNGDANIGGDGLADMRVRGNSTLGVAGQLTLADGNSLDTQMFVDGGQVTAEELSIASENSNNAQAELFLRFGGQLQINSGAASTLASVGDGEGSIARLQANNPGSSIDIVGGADGATLAVGTDIRGVTGTGVGIFTLGNEATATVRGAVDGNNNVIVGDGREGQLSVTTDSSMDIDGSLFIGVGGVGTAGAATGGQLTIGGSVATASTGRIGVDVGVAALDGALSQANFSAISAGTQVLVQSTNAAVQAYMDVGLTNVAARAGSGSAFGRISVSDGAELILDSVGNTALVTVGQGQGGDGEINLGGVGSVMRLTGTGALLQLAGTGSYGAIGDGDGILRVSNGASLELAGTDPSATGLNVGVGAGNGTVLVSGGGTINVDGALILGTPVASGAPTAGARGGNINILNGGSVSAIDTLIGVGGNIAGDESASFSTNSLTVEPGGVFNYSGDLSVADLVLDSAFYLNDADFDLDDTTFPVSFTAANTSRVEVRGNMLIGGAGANTAVAISDLGSLLNVGGAGTRFTVGSDGGAGDFALADGALATFDGTLLGAFLDQAVLSVGVGGDGSFSVVNGARFTMQDSNPGADGNAVRVGVAGATDVGNGSMLVDGAQTAFTHNNVNAIFEVGVADTAYAGTGGANGVLDVTNSAFVRVAATAGDGSLVIGRGAGANGTVNVGSGGSLSVEGAVGGRLSVGTDDGTLSAGGGDGTLNIDNSFANVAGFTAGASEAFVGHGAGTGTLNLSNGGSLFVDGDLFIAADNPISGNAGSGGNVLVDEFSFLGANNVTVAANGRLQSTGTVQGQLTAVAGSELVLSGTQFDNIINQGGRLSLGGDTAPGQLTVIGDYTQAQGTLFLSLHGFAPGTFDQLNVLGNVDLAGGAVELDFLDGFSPDLANGLPLITASGTLNIDPDLAYNVGAGIPAFELSPLEILVLDQDTGQQVPQQVALLNFLSIDLTTLVETLGFTPNEVELVNSLERTCSGVAGTDGLNQDQLDFLNICADVRNAGNTPEQILQTVKALDTEEVMQLVNSILLFTIPQHGNLSQRINALRSGADPFDLSGLNLRVGDHQIAGADLDRFVKGLLGGGAGASDGFAKWGVFGNGNYNFGDRDATENADGYDFETISLTIGVDYRARDNLVLGGSLSYSDVNADFDEGGGMDLKSWSASLFGTYFVKDKYYLDVMATYGQNDIESTRNLTFTTAVNSYDRRAYADTDGDQFSLSLGTGYDFTPGAWVLGPHGGLNYTEIDADSYTERGADGLNLSIARQTATSFTANIGAHASYTFTPKWGVLIPYVRADWVHEFERDAEITEVNFNVARFVNDPDNPSIPFEVRTDRRDANYMVFSAGVSAQFVQGISGFLNYRTTSKLENIDTTDITWGMRFERRW